MRQVRYSLVVLLLVLVGLAGPAFFASEPPRAPAGSGVATGTERGASGGAGPTVSHGQVSPPSPAAGHPPAGAAPLTTNRVMAMAGEFVETFDGNGAAPAPFSSPRWDVVVHTRHADASERMDAMAAHHGGDCSPFPNTHQIGSHNQTVFLCRDHLMTSLRADDYGLIYLTPDHLVDFSQGEAVIRFNMSTLRTSSRDWVDIWISPFEDHLQLPFDTGDVDLQGVPRRAIHIRMDDANGQGTMFRPTIYVNHKSTDDFPPFSNTFKWGTGYESVLQPSGTRRDTFELRISRTHLAFGLPEYNLWWVDRDITPLDWSQGVVQFGHHSYTPEKDCTSPDPIMCKANTWHWDNVSINPAVPFTMIKASPRWASNSSTLIQLPQPAPADGWLRFSGIGKGLQVRFDGGDWQAAPQAAQEPRPQDSEGHFASYWLPVPAGSTQIEFAGERWWGGDWRVKDVAVWSRTGTDLAQVAGGGAPPASRPATDSPPKPAPPPAPAESTCRIWVEINGVAQWRQIDNPQVKEALCGNGGR